MGYRDYIAGYAAIAAGACAVTLVLEPLFLHWARWSGVIERPSERRVHQEDTPGAGGIVFFPVLVVCAVLALYLWPDIWRAQYAGFLAAALLITVAGLYDDVFDMRASAKFACQIGAGAILFFSGYHIGRLSVPFTRIIIDVGHADFVLTVLLVAAIINAVNLLDGLDGLASGSVFIICVFLLLNKLANGLFWEGLLPVAGMGMTLGFLRYNAYPAKVFMGDTGAMLLGLVLAAEVLDSVSQGAAVTAALIPIVIMGIPVFDMLRTMITRARSSRSMFKADKSHLHHRLLDIGLSHREAVYLVYLMNVYMGIMSVVYKRVEVPFRGLYLLSICLFLVVTFYLAGVAQRRARREPDAR